MFKHSIILATTLAAGVALGASAEQVPIHGTVESRCIIQTDSAGTFGNPNAYTLTTTPTDGGEPAVVRFDITLADAYYAEITPPTAFSSAPNLPDQVTWDGSVEVSAVSDAGGMGTYETSKVELGSMDRYDMTATGSTWFKINATATMGGNKAFPGGTYTAVAEAVCVAK